MNREEMENHMLANYHTHSKWCHHGKGEIEEFIEEAVNAGFQEIAITEHVPYRNNRDFNRMQWEEFPWFDRALERAISSYKNQIKIIKGFECEFYPEEMDSYRHLQEDYGYEFLILGQHRAGKNREIDIFAPKGPKELQIYADQVCEGIRTGMFRFVCHPDVALTQYINDEFDEACEKMMRHIFACCEKYNTPIEINANGIRNQRRYPDKHAFSLANEYNLKCIINSDAHFPQDINDEAVHKAEQLAKDLNIPIIELL